MTRFSEKPQTFLSLEDNRLFMRHGPIDLFVDIQAANEITKYQIFRNLSEVFASILPDLCSELPLLRMPITERSPTPMGPVAQRMHGAAARFRKDHFVTPMISVAGAVADHLLDTISRDERVERAFVNNGGDIAIHLREEETLRVGIASDVKTKTVAQHIEIDAAQGVGGIATSGWSGRSHSLGIADAVTVLATDAASADAAATLIANHIDLPGSPKIERQPATRLSPDSDLGERLVTTRVFDLTEKEKQDALARGRKVAEAMVHSRAIVSAFLSCQNLGLVVGGLPSHETQGAMPPFPMEKTLNKIGGIHA